MKSEEEKMSEEEKATRKRCFSFLSFARAHVLSQMIAPI